MTDVLLQNAAVIVALMVLVWLLSLPLRDVSIVDIAWGFGFVLIAWSTYFSAAAKAVNLVLPVLTTLWGLRLSGYLAWRKVGTPEDFRYGEMRNRNPRSFPIRSLLMVFALQGVLMWTIALPLQTADPAASVSIPLTTVGILLWLVGFLFEAIGDRQLARFKSKPANEGRVMDRGLWHYTRHPNYFGDFLVWWALYLVAIGAGAPYWTAIGPIVMSVLLMRISGVTLLEKSLRSRKEGYAAYIARTNAFFPWWPRATR